MKKPNYVETMRHQQADWALTVKRHQIDWAFASGRINPEMLELRHGQPSWVLKKEHRAANLHREEWWKYIEGHEHRWARALNSSQCFAVNLFSPCRDDKNLAKTVLSKLVTNLPDLESSQVAVHFEYTPGDAEKWLGEKGQATQVDVAFQVDQRGQQSGYVLIEVKFSE